MTKEEILSKKIGFISLGCDKNRVDLEHMIASIVGEGFTITNDESEANVIIVNSCAFLQASREEALSELRYLKSLKQNNLEKVVLTGCLTRYKNLYETELEELVDIIVPIKNNSEIASCIYSAYGLDVKCSFDMCDRVLTTPSHIAYLKIAEGCNNRCAYCAIPNIRGKYVSRDMESLVEEAKRLAQKGVKELIIVAQDVTNYGFEKYKKRCLIDLLQQLEAIEGISWIRLHYCYPEYITDELIDYIKQSKKVVNYIDVPLQHVCEDMLITMNRKNTEEQTHELISKLNKEGINIRSTFIVGFPGESKQEFKQLLRFLKLYKMQNVGFFAYSNEVGTKAYEMTNQIAEKVKQKRLRKAQKVQNKIYKKLQKQSIGQERDVIIDSIAVQKDEQNENFVYICRDQANSYMVDSVIQVLSNKEHNCGEIIKVKIVSSIDIDLVAEEI